MGNGIFDFSDRVKKLPVYIFAEIDKLKERETKTGRKLISLAVGDPDSPTPDFVVARMKEALNDPLTHRYPTYWGLHEFRKAVSDWYTSRFGVKLDPASEVMALIGSKEGISQIVRAFVNPGEATLVPDPGYPTYRGATLLSDGVPLFFKLKEENGFLPDLAELEALIKKGPKVRMLFLNYPNNPTAAVAGRDFFREVVAFAKKHEIIVCHDNAYSEIYFDGKKQPSFLEVPGAMDIGCEFHSMSKTFNMAGWRLGFVVGNAKIISGLAQVKTNCDSGVFNAIQLSGIEALKNYEPFCSELRAVYQKRRDIFVPALKEVGLRCQVPQASFYVWAGLKEGVKSSDFVVNLIKEKGIIATPGMGFGQAGEGYVRFALCQDISVLKQVAQALKGSV